MKRRLKELVRRALPVRIKDHRIRQGLLRDARLVTSWHDYPGAILGTTERPLLEWFEKHVRAGETWLDVGAHYGYTAIALSRLVGDTGRVFAFEPVLSTAGCIARTRELNQLRQLTVVALGLDRTDDLSIAELPTVRGMADSTIVGGKRCERIMTTSLDSLWPSLCARNPRIAGIKIDVQGMEFAVLKGMRRILATWSPRLVVEFHAGVDREPILDLLRACGYTNPCEPIDPRAAPDTLADDHSYAFVAAQSKCESSFTASSTARI